MVKIRNGFVSNSSSSSFVLDKDYMTDEQIEKMRNHFTEEYNGFNESDAEIRFYVMQEDAYDFFKEINLGMKAIKEDIFHG